MSDDDCFSCLRELLRCQTDIIWWPIIYALIAVFGTFVLIFMLSQNSPPNLLPCACPVEDFGMIAGTATILEPRASIANNTFTLLRYVGVVAPYTNTSTTSNASKFPSPAPSPVPPATLFYTPVFTGTMPVKINGSAAASINVTSSSPDLLVTFGVAWSNDNVTWNTISQSSMRTASPNPGWVTFSMPYAVAFTRAQMNPAGAVAISAWIRVLSAINDAQYAVTSITIVASEV